MKFQRTSEQTTMESQSTTSSSAIDTEIVLERLNGDRAMLAVLATFFLEDAPQLLERLHVGLQANSLSQVLSSSHSLRGLASTFEPTPVVELAAEIESHSRSGDTARLAELITTLDIEFVRLVEALQSIRSPSQ